MEGRDDDVIFVRATHAELGEGRIRTDRWLLTEGAEFSRDEAADWWKVLHKAAEKAIMGDEVYVAGLGLIFAEAIERANGDPKRLLAALGLVRPKGRRKVGWKPLNYGLLQVALIKRHDYSPEEALEFAADHLSEHEDMTVERSTLQRWRKEAEDRLEGMQHIERERIFKEIEDRLPDARK